MSYELILVGFVPRQLTTMYILVTKLLFMFREFVHLRCTSLPFNALFWESKNVRSKTISTSPDFVSAEETKYELRQQSNCFI